MSQQTPPCQVVTFETPTDRLLLQGLLYGTDTATRAFVFIHGLGSSALDHHELLAPLAHGHTAVLYFGNRGHDQITGIKQADPSSPKGYSRIRGGSAHEVFTDSPDDIQGAVTFLKHRGIREIFLVGHSTGSQKTAYYLAQAQPDRAVKGGVLLCPISDYASTSHFTDPLVLQAAAAHAQGMVNAGHDHDLLPAEIWPETIDAQRFLSLCTPDSAEEIFSYAQPQKAPATLQSVRRPLLIMFAENDEYMDRPLEQIAGWFAAATAHQPSDIKTIPGSLHNLRGAENFVAEKLVAWTNTLDDR